MKHRTGYACAFSLFTLFLGAADITWTGAGADTRFSTAANWDTAPSFDGSETFIFAEAGTTATVDGVFSLGAIRFNRSNSFTLVPADGTANIHLGTGGASPCSPLPRARSFPIPTRCPSRCPSPTNSRSPAT